MISGFETSLMMAVRHMFIPAESIFLAILVEAVPFVLLGALLSSIIHEFVSADKIVKWMPKNHIVAILFSGMLGLVAPSCDCGTIPVARSLLSKQVPRHAVITYGLSAPVINPITIVATFVAFGFSLRVTIIRVFLTYCIACLVGFVLGSDEADSRILAIDNQNNRQVAHSATNRIRTGWHRLRSIVDHTTHELFGIVGFLICSAAVAAIYEVFHTQQYHFGHLHQGIFAVVSMMVFGMIFSLCSNADAFVARSFSTSYSLGSVIAFMLISQLADLRNLFLIPKTFGLRIGVSIIGLCILFTLICGLLV